MLMAYRRFGSTLFNFEYRTGQNNAINIISQESYKSFYGHCERRWRGGRQKRQLCPAIWYDIDLCVNTKSFASAHTHKLHCENIYLFNWKIEPLTQKQMSLLLQPIDDDLSQLCLRSQIKFFAERSQFYRSLLSIGSRNYLHLIDDIEMSLTNMSHSAFRIDICSLLRSD